MPQSDSQTSFSVDANWKLSVYYDKGEYCMKQGIVRTTRTVCNRVVRGAREICFNQSKALHRSG